MYERERERESVEPTGYGTQKEGELTYEVQPTNEQERAKRFVGRLKNTSEEGSKICDI